MAAAVMHIVCRSIAAVEDRGLVGKTPSWPLGIHMRSWLGAVKSPSPRAILRGVLQKVRHGATEVPNAFQLFGSV